MHKDPVCGMDVRPDKAAAKSEYRGQTYYFCSANCKQTFDSNPEMFLQRAGGHSGHSHGCC